MNHRAIILFGAATLAAPMLTQAEEWLGPEEPATRLSVGYGEDEAGYRVASLGADLPLSNGGRFSLAAERGELPGGRDTAYYRAGLSSDPLAESVARVDGIVQDTDDGASIREVKLESTRYFEHWDLGFRARGGYVEVEAQESGVSDHKGLRGGAGLGVGYQAGPVRFSLGGTEYFYRWEDDDPESDGSSLLSNRRGAFGQPAFGSGSSGGSQREPILIEREATAMATLFTGPVDWQVGAQRTVDTDGASRDWLLLGSSYHTPAGHWIGLNVDVPREDDGAVFGQVTLGVQL